MIIINDKKECCGCWACYNACPKKCIEMKEDDEGFRYPEINKDKCIDCGICEKVCPIINADKEDKPHKQIGYLLQHKNDQIRQESTSGGAYTALSSWVIKQGGVAFGAGFRNDTFIVEHQAVSSIDHLSIFRNSKYVQSNVSDTYVKVKNNLKEGKWVIFSGTPCQIEGLRHFLRLRDYEKLILVDLVCRGIPSPLVLAKHIEMQQSLIGGKFTNILFRDKYYGYHYSSFSIYNENPKKDYHKGVDTNEYLRAFFNNLSDRPSCYDCKFKKRYRKSDITIWDCFPIEEFTKDFDGKGTTRVLVHTEKGKNLLNSISNDVRLIEVDADKLTKGVREMFHSVPYNPKREQFFVDLNNMKAKEFFEKWFPTTLSVKMNAFIRLSCHKLGIYTFIKRLFMIFYTRKDERCR